MPVKQYSTLTSGQGDFLQQLLSMLKGQGMQGGQNALKYYMDLLSGSPESYEKFEAPIMRQFNEEIVPGIAERFTGIGGQKSSAFQQALGSAGSGLSERLASMRGGLQQQGAQGLLQALMGLSGQGLGTRSFENIYQPKAPSFLQSLFGGLSGGIGSGLGLGAGMGGFGGLMQMLSRMSGQKGGVAQ